MGKDYSKRLKRVKYHFLQSNGNDENKKKIIEFTEYLIANDLSPARRLKYFYTLKTMTKKPIGDIITSYSVEMTDIKLLKPESMSPIIE